ncbi:MAG TPA: CsgG/HfaB family protein [Devosia sp.]|jgi:curli biogenesis system outer membrane secretion channel CsgG|nr:CsgG/HfaB family protein [Devosia sp.]
MLKLGVLGVLPALFLSGCTTLLPSMVEPKPVRYGPVPIATITPADAALECLSRSPEVKRAGVFAVHVISDQTGKYSQNDEGGYVPRDAASMLVTALQKAGVKQVNRVDTAVTEWEMARAKEQVLGDGHPDTVGDQTVDFRPLLKGSLRGSDYVIDGAITQLDFNTYSGGGEAYLNGVGAGARNFALTVAADIRVTRTQSTEIALARSYSKQAVGTEVEGSVYRFFGNDLFDIDVGEKSQEGLEAGIRWLLADAAYDIVSKIVHHNGSCDKFLPEASQAVRAEQPAATLAVANRPPDAGNTKW